VTLIFIALILITLLQVWFRIADHYQIIDKPNERSSHSIITIRGGGIIVPIAITLWFGFLEFPYPWFTGGVLLIAIISLIDDINPLPSWLRFSVHVLAVAALFWGLGLFNIPWYWVLLALVLVIGTINAFNFMDGINGITAFYALACLMGFHVINSFQPFTDANLIKVTGLALVLFSFYNARRKARTFAGDVGSVSIAFILCFLMLQLILQTHNPAYILLFAVYGVDAVLTIIHRLLKGEYIFQAHRSHLYQYLANEQGIPHVMVSVIYAGLQLGVNALVIYAIHHQLIAPWILIGGILLTLGILYILTKAHILYKQLQH
jgi:UDP-GlcNAc:undecaprenyl-phosphate GlcNAc-1-phosphate transferase